MNTTERSSPQVPERAVRPLFEQEGEHASRWAEIESITLTMGSTAETLCEWVRQAAPDQGRRAGVTSAERDRLKDLERENWELKRFCARRRGFLPRRSSTADGSNGGVYRGAPRRTWGRADLR